MCSLPGNRGGGSTIHSPAQMRWHSVGPFGGLLRSVYRSERNGCLRSPRFDRFAPLREDYVFRAVHLSLSVNCVFFDQIVTTRSAHVEDSLHLCGPLELLRAPEGVDPVAVELSRRTQREGTLQRDLLGDVARTNPDDDLGEGWIVTREQHPMTRRRRRLRR